MRNGARAQLRGDTEGGSVWSTATAHTERLDLGIRDDDGLYCTLKIVFAPTRPDATGYSIKFVDGNWHPGIRTRGVTGYGVVRTVGQACRSRADPPDKNCPESAPGQ